MGCICSIGKKSFGPVLILIPGNSTSLEKCFRLAACARKRRHIPPHETGIVAPLQL